MNSQTTFDYIIVGQGLAGSCLSLQLLQRGKKVLVIDRKDDHSATQVAAGLFNPITGKKMTRTWMADLLYPYLHEFYRQAEKLTGHSFFYPMPLYRPFLSVEEQNEWMGKSGDPKLGTCIDRVFTSPIDTDFVKNKFGGLLLKQCGYLNTIKFSDAVRSFIRQAGGLLEDDFTEDDLKIENESVEYKGNRAEKIIFCQGVRTGKFFSWLPIKPLKGETITLSPPQGITKIYNRGVYVVPDIWKVGATYQFQDLTPSITEEGLNELTGKLQELINFPFKIVGQTWGMRPVTPDRRPILGPHPESDLVLIFNGLGTKGVSLAPYFSNVLAEWLENRTAINKEVDIHRYKHYNYGGILLR